MADILTGDSPVEATAKLSQFKDYAVSHPQLVQVDEVLRRAIREPAGFAHVLVYGPSGVGKTTMIRQIARRFQETALDSPTAQPSYGNGSPAPVPLLLLETRPPDGGAFNRADYYRTALKLLGEPFYERRLLVDVDSEQAWEKKGRSRSKATQFHDSPELRQALEAAMARRGVRAVILDEAQHLLKLGSGSSGGKLLDQLDWLKSMTNVTGVLHILIGTYELLNFRNLSGQTSRRGLDLHFPKLGYADSRREHLWRLLQAGMDATGVPSPVASTVADAQSQETVSNAPSPDKTSRRKRSSASNPKAATKEVEVLTEPAPKKRQAGKKTKKTADQAREASPDVESKVGDAPSPEIPPAEATSPQKKPARRVGQRQPKRDPVG